jgi:ribonucleoside-diphosphate reductase beta chain
MDSSSGGYREGFATLRAAGLNWDSLPLRLFAKGNATSWDPASLDFSTDAEHWAARSGDERRAATTLCAMFLAGEEAVTGDLLPFIAAMAAEGRLGDQMYLTQFCYEEAKHTAAFRRWLDAVGVTGDLHSCVEGNPGYRAMFYQALPESLRLLAADPGPASQVLVSVSYNHVAGGVLALTGYYAWNKVCQRLGIMPGMRQMIKHIASDERRHMAWGTYTCRRHVAADDANWALVQQRMDELLPLALGIVQWVFSQFDPMPFDLDPGEFIGYAADRAQRRLSAIATARGAPPAQIDLDDSPEQLEDQFSEEDAAALAAAG